MKYIYNIILIYIYIILFLIRKYEELRRRIKSYIWCIIEYTSTFFLALTSFTYSYTSFTLRIFVRKKHSNTGRKILMGRVIVRRDRGVWGERGERRRETPIKAFREVFTS